MSADPAVIHADAFMIAQRRWLDLEGAADSCLEEARKLFAEPPPEIRIRDKQAKPGERQFFPMSIPEAERCSFYPGQLERRLGLIAAYVAEKEAILARFGHPELEAKAEAAHDECTRLVNVLRDTRATTAAGMLAKLRIAISFSSDSEFVEEVDPDSTYVAPAMFSSVVADLKRMVGEPV